MANISHSRPKRSFTSYSNVAFTSHKSVYDDVFGAPPRFGLPTLAPRLDDYSEIFGGVRASRSFSLPVLDIIGDDSDLLHFDGDFDYTEVFGDSRGVGFASFQDIVGQSSCRYDSSDEPWSPAQNGSLSGDFDALAGSDKSLRVPDGAAHQSLGTTKQFNASYNMSSQSNIGTVLTETSRVTKFSSLPGYTFSHYGSPVSWDGEDENCSISVVSDLNINKIYGKRITEEKQYTKYSENSVHSGLNVPRNDFDLLEEHGNSTSKPFMVVSDISLRTKPSRLPPPSRPPPALVVKKLDSDRSDLKLKASKSYAFERVSDDSASPSFDVKVDATLSPEDRENGNKNVKSKHGSTKESIERKDIKSHNAIQVEEKTNKTARVSNSIMEEMLESHGKETTTSLPLIEDRIESTRGIEDISGSDGVRYCNLHNVDISARPVAWREATEYFEVIEKNASKEAFDTMILHMDRDAYRHRSTRGYDTFNGQEDWEKLKMSKEAQGLEEERMHPQMTCEQKEIPSTRLSDQRGFQEKVILNKLDSRNNLHKMVPENIHQFGECDMLQADHTETKERVKLRTELEGIKKQHTGAFGKENENKLKETHDPSENEMTSEEAKEHGESDKKSYLAVGLGKTGDGQLACEVEKDQERLMEAGKHIKNELIYRDALQQVNDENEDKLHHETEVTQERSGDASKTEESGLRFRRADIDADNMVEVFKIKGYANLNRAGGVQEKLSGHAEEIEPIERNQPEKEVERDVDTYFLIEEDQLKELNAGCKRNEAIATKVSGKYDNEWVGQSNVEPNNSANETEAGFGSSLVKGKSNGFSNNRNELLDRITRSATNNKVESSCLPKQMIDSNIRGSGMGTSCVMTDRISSALACSHESEKIMSTDDDQGPPIEGTQFIRKMVGITDTFTPCQVFRESTVNGKKVEDASSMLKHSDETQFPIKNAASQRIQRKGYIVKENLTAKEQKVGDRIRREIELENEHIRKIEEEKEREREREKDRMAVDKAALEARERSYAHTCERTERAALERDTAEVRQRAMAGARERLEKASIETKLRAERAAVERATAEARQRAAEKSVAQKAAFEVNDHVERSVLEKFPAHFSSADTRQNSLSFNIHLQSAGISNSLRYSYSSAHVGADGESPQRCKARLERCRRTETALAEKNKRDLLAQREREEMNRVAESLDAEVKRWSSGKEGSLRSLLSTLQYILGPDSGWQPVPLTEIITSAAVKKAYRKATLCVHPDKLQQRGASVQQKYICKKVFDLLKEAWNKFNTEER